MTLVKKQNVNADVDNTHDFSSFFRGVLEVLSFPESAVKLNPACDEKKIQTDRKLESGYVMGNWVRRYKTESFLDEYQEQPVLRLRQSSKYNLVKT
jgi:hypothetical protein